MFLLSKSAIAQSYSMEWCCSGVVKKMQLDCINNSMMFNGVKYLVLETRTTKEYTEYKVTQNELTDVETILCYFHKDKKDGEIFDTQFSQIFHQKKWKNCGVSTMRLKEIFNYKINFLLGKHL